MSFLDEAIEIDQIYNNKENFTRRRIESSAITVAKNTAKKANELLELLISSEKSNRDYRQEVERINKEIINSLNMLERELESTIKIVGTRANRVIENIRQIIDLEKRERKEKLYHRRKVKKTYSEGINILSQLERIEKDIGY